MTKIRFGGCVSAVTMTLLLAGHAAAQTASPTAPAAEEAPHLDDVVVTAQRRSENLQKTALTVSALTGATLAARGITDISALSTQLPSLEIANSGGGTTQVFMRGVGSTNVTEVGDSAIAIQMDGIYIARPNSFGSSLYDLDRIEVLRGPQGTLYGRNATAGAINVITKRPTQEFGGNASIEYGNYNQLTTSGAINIPVTDTLAVRASFQTVRHDGYQKSTTTGAAAGNDKQDQDDKAARIQALWKPTERFSLLLRADYLHQGGAGGGDQNYPLVSDPRDFASTLVTRIDNTLWSVGAEAKYDLGFAEITYLTGYNSTRINRLRENTASHVPNYLDLSTDTFSNELRIGKDSGNFKWVLGLYSFDENTYTNYAVYRPATADYTDYLSPTVKSNSKAAFGQVTYSVTPRFRVTGGLRYTHDDKSRYGGVYITDANGAIKSTVSLNAASDSWNSTNWKAGADFDVTDQILAYASASTGYKAGGYYDGVGANSYKPEHITAYEVGLKSRFLDNRAQLNLSGYWYDYRDFQVTAQRVLSGALSSITLNANKARIYGIEAEFNFLLTENDRFDAYATWLHSEYTDFTLPVGDAITNNNANAAYAHCYATNYAATAPRSASFDGCSLAKAPNWTLNGGYQHTFDLGGSGRVTARVQSHFETMQYLEYHGFQQNVQKSYTKTDVSVTYEPTGKGWSVMAYGRNLENNDVRVNSSPNTGTGSASNGSGDYYAPPRTYGVRLAATF